MKVLITGTSRGIGRETALKFLIMGHTVYGMDVLDSTINDEKYTHYSKNILDEDLPDLEVDVLVNNAAVQNANDIDVNLKGTIHVTEKYGVRPGIKSIVMVASSSARTGSEFPEYAASKGGVVAYMKNVSSRVAKYGATCNSISPGGVTTELNRHILESEELYRKVLDETTLNKWATPEEIAEWIYFVAVVNKSMTAQDILIDNGEESKYNFIW